MLKVRIVNTKNLDVKDEEYAINKALEELESREDVNIYIVRLTYRYNSIVIEYSIIPKAYEEEQDASTENSCIVYESINNECSQMDYSQGDLVSKAFVSPDSMKIDYLFTKMC